MTTKHVPPFLKWAGGKRWLTTAVGPLSSSRGQTYFEPFAGSAAMFFHHRPRKAVLSDMNSHLVEAFQAIKERPADVFAVLKRHAALHDETYYYKIRSLECRTPVTRAARFIYLNRTCWNGLYRVNRLGKFNVPKGTKTAVLLSTDDFEEISGALQNAEILTSDFEIQIDRAKAGDFIFADPPYTVRHKHNGFIKYNEQLFSWDDQVRLCEALKRAKNRGVEILVTNADHESIRTLYKECFALEQIARYSAIAGSAARRGSFDELLIR